MYILIILKHWIHINPDFGSSGWVSRLQNFNLDPISNSNIAFKKKLGRGDFSVNSFYDFQVEYMSSVESIPPIPAVLPPADNHQTTVDDVSKLQLTIDGVTRGFDDFMDTYVNKYFPHVDSQTYRWW